MVQLKDQRKNLRDFLFYAYNIVSLYKKKALSFTPLNCALNALSLALNDSAAALVALLKECISKTYYHYI